tara:strand:- start:34414 stop:34857 length:444 start_codon:yes stop_codon:yes gene_type:complete
MERSIGLFWFSKTKRLTAQTPIEMSPLEAVTNLVCIIQLSDNNVDYEEKASWSSSVTNLFPNYSKERAEKYLQLAYSKIGNMDKNQANLYLIEILNRIKVFLDNGELKNLAPCIENLVMSDGILISSESEICKVIETRLNIQLRLTS